MKISRWGGSILIFSKNEVRISFSTYKPQLKPHLIKELVNFISRDALSIHRIVKDSHSVSVHYIGIVLYLMHYVLHK